VGETKVEFIKPQAFSIDSTIVGAPVAIGAEGDEVVVVMRLTRGPGDNMVHVDLNVSAGRNCAAVASLDENASSEISRYWRTPVRV
jgi:hypothetical protein